MIPQIRGMHPYSFRSGQWATLIGVHLLEGHPDSPRPCYLVQFPDGVTDSWPIYDSGYEYEYQNLTVTS